MSSHWLWLIDGEIQIKDALKVTKYTINKHKQKQTNKSNRMTFNGHREYKRRAGGFVGCYVGVCVEVCVCVWVSGL